MNFDKDKAIKLAKSLSDKFSVEDVQNFIAKHKDLKFLDDVKILFSMIKDATQKKYQLDTKTYVIIAGALTYLVIPTDLIPDFIPGIGFVDDAFVITYTLTTIKDELDKYKKFLNDKTR